MAKKPTIQVEGDVLILRLPIDAETVNSAEMSASGKSVLVAATKGYHDLEMTVAGKDLAVSAMVIGKFPKRAHG